MKQSLAKQNKDRDILFYVKESEKASLPEMEIWAGTWSRELHTNKMAMSSVWGMNVPVGLDWG